MKELLKTKAFKYLLASIVFSIVVVFAVNTNLIFSTFSAAESSSGTNSGSATKYIGGDIVLKSGVDLIPNSTNAADMKKNTTNLQKAIDTVSNSGGGTVKMPSGTFYFSLGGTSPRGEEYAIRCRNNVALIGAGTNENNVSKSTILKPFYNNPKSTGGMDMFYFNNYADSGFNSSGKVTTSTKKDVKYTNANGTSVTLKNQTVYLINADFYDFVIDAEQSMGGIKACGGSYQTDGKGFMINLFADCNWDNVVVKNTDGTGFGVDCPINSTMNNCKAINCGKAALATDGGASGFGIGTGYSDQESFIITNSVAINNKKFGFFFEHQARFSNYYPSTVSQKFVVADSIAGGNMYDFGGLKTFDLTFQNVKSISGQGTYTDSNLKKTGTSSGGCGYSTINYSGSGIALNKNTNPIYFSMYSFNNYVINSDVASFVKDISLNKAEVTWAINKGILPVSNGTTVGATNSITRFEAVQALWRYNNMPGTISTDLTSKDVSNYKSKISGIGFGDLGDAKYQYDLDAIVWAHDNGLISTDTAFNPSRATSRAEFVTMMYRMAGSQGGSKELPFTDVPVGVWYYKPLQWAYENGLVQGTTSTTFTPDGPITKQQFAAVLYRYETKVKKDFRINYNLMGGEGTNKVWYSQDELPYTLKNPSKDGYNFLGWSGSNGKTPSKKVTISKGTTGDLVYTANWEEIKNTVTSIKVSSEPIKTIYTSGEKLDMEGLTLLVNYSNGTTGRVSTGFSYTPENAKGTGEQKITVRYHDKETSFYITVKPITQPKVTKIKIIEPAKKLQYNVGDKIDTTGLVLEVTYSNGDVEKITGGFAINPNKAVSSGKNKTISVSYGGVSTSYKIDVDEPILTGISISTHPSKTKYMVGEILNTSGLILKATYSDGSTKKIYTGFSVEPADLVKTGKHTVDVFYGEQQTSFDITVEDEPEKVTLKSLSISSFPNNRSFFVGDVLSTTGLKLKAVYSDGSSRIISSGFSKSHNVLTQIGEYDVTITYGGKSVKYGITVNAKETITATVSKIEIYNLPKKTEYKVSEMLDTTGLTIKVTYSDGVTQLLYEDFDVSPIIFNQTGSTRIDVIYEKKRAYFYVNVIPDEPIKLTVKKISVSSPPTISTYTVGDTLNTDGLKIKVTYSDGSTRIITTGFDVPKTKFKEGGVQKIDVSYEGQKTSFDVVVNPKVEEVTVKKLVITQKPDKLQYKIGDKIDTSGLILTATNTDGTSNIILSGFKVVTKELNKVGKHEVKIEYGGASVSYDVTVIDASLSKIVIDKYPTKLTYTIGDKVDLTGLVLTAIYNDGSTQTITNGFTVSPTSISGTQNKTLTINYGGKTVTYGVSVNPKPIQTNIISKIQVSKKPNKVQYKIGDVIDTTGLRLYITYTDGAVAEVMDGFTVDKTPFTKKGLQKVTVSYKGKTTTFDVNVIEVVLSSIEVTTKPTKLTYTVGEKLDTTGLVLTLNYSDNSTKTVTTGYKVNVDKLTQKGLQRVTVEYQGKTTYFEVSANMPKAEVKLTKIKIKTKPKKLTYTVGDKVNTTGLILTATYSDKSTKLIMDGFTVTPTKFEKKGKQDVTITFGGQKTTYEVQVNKKEEQTSNKISKISIKTQPNKLKYKVGDELDTNGLVLKATYKDGTTKNIKEGYTVSPQVLEKSGKQKITVKYEGKKVTFNVQVDKVKVKSIELKSLPTKTSYFVGDKFSYLGLAMTLYYDNGYINEITSDFNLSIAEGSILEEIGKKEVIIYYDDLQLSFDIEVLPKNSGNLIIATKPDKVIYYVGEKFDTTGLVLNSIDKTGKKVEVNSNYTVSIKQGAVLSDEGTLPVIVTYNNDMVEFDIKVLNIKRIKVKEESVKRRYSIGDKFSTKGMILIVEYTDGTKEEIKDNYEVEQIGKFESLGDYNIKVKYGNKETDLRVRVIDGAAEKAEKERYSKLKTIAIVIGVIAGSVVLIVVGFNLYLLFL